MKLSRPQPQEARQAAEAPAAELGAQKAAHARLEAFRAQAQASSVRGSATMMSVASGTAAVPNYDQPTVDLGIDLPAAVAPSVAYVGNEMVWAYGDSARVYHVTERATASDIQREGFLGGWGDCGFGLYVYTTPGEALDYAKRGGWDKSLEDPIVLVAHIPIRLLRQPEIHPDWDPESYECVLWVPMDEDAESEALHPELLGWWDALAGDPAPEIFPQQERASDLMAGAPVRQIDTREFEAWFGDSKVVDAKLGEPLVLYHGTQNKFWEFDSSPDWGLGSHFGTIKQARRVLGQVEDGRLIPVFLSIKNPVRLLDPGDAGWMAEVTSFDLERRGVITEAEWERISCIHDDIEARRVFVDILKAKGYDGAVYRNRREGGGDSWITFSSNQIKSAEENCGAFSLTDPDIRR